MPATQWSHWILLVEALHAIESGYHRPEKTLTERIKAIRASFLVSSAAPTALQLGSKSRTKAKLGAKTVPSAGEMPGMAEEKETPSTCSAVCSLK